MSTAAIYRDREIKVAASKAALAAIRPEWAKALIVAEYESDQCDSQSDYFATKTERVVGLAWSRHERDIFSEMRKAAALFPQTEHLGPNCGLFTPRVVLVNAFSDRGRAHYEGEWSHWHSEVYDQRDPRTFTTLEQAQTYVDQQGAPYPVMFGETEARFAWTIDSEKIEHREKYSMGAGYYLKATGRYSSGWLVRKTRADGGGDVIELAGNLAHRQSMERAS